MCCIFVLLFYDRVFSIEKGHWIDDRYVLNFSLTILISVTHVFTSQQKEKKIPFPEKNLNMYI